MGKIRSEDPCEDLDRGLSPELVESSLRPVARKRGTYGDADDGNGIRIG